MSNQSRYPPDLGNEYSQFCENNSLLNYLDQDVIIIRDNKIDSKKDVSCQSAYPPPDVANVDPIIMRTIISNTFHMTKDASNESNHCLHQASSNCLVNSILTDNPDVSNLAIRQRIDCLNNSKLTCLDSDDYSRYQAILSEK